MCEFAMLVAEINLSDPAKDAYYRQHAIVVLPGLGTPRSARTIEVPGARVAWGITMLTDAPNKQNAIKFLQLLLRPRERRR
jgi:ABC-type molybdate transport system substrate-binding protein